MRNLRTRVSALTLAVIMASGMATIFSTPVSASDGRFAPPSNEDICAALATAEANLVNLPPAAAAALQKLIDAAQERLGCD